MLGNKTLFFVRLWASVVCNVVRLLFAGCKYAEMKGYELICSYLAS